MILPLSNNEQFRPIIDQVANMLRRQDVSFRIDDSSSSIGRRYSRADEVGVPFAITIDFETLKDQTVTLRERDEGNQVRGSVRRDVSYVICRLTTIFRLPR